MINRQVLDLWNRYKPTIAVDAIEYDRELKKLLSTNLASLGTDAISRQQAIDDIWTVSPLACLDRKWVDRWLRQLPPIQPVNISETPNSSDTISRQQAIDAIEKWLHGLFGITEADGTATIFKTIRQLPPIQPDIVRCKDCKHWIPYDWMFSEVWRSKNMADYPEDEIGCNWCDMAMKANDFCSRGEKREATT